MDDERPVSEYRIRKSNRNSIVLTIVIVVLLVVSAVMFWQFSHRDRYAAVQSIPYTDVTSNGNYSLSFLSSENSQITSIPNMQVYENSMGIKVVNTSSDDRN